MRVYLLFILISLPPFSWAEGPVGAELSDTCNCPDLEELSGDIVKILNKGFKLGESPEIALEVDKLNLLADIQIAANEGGECHHYQKSYFAEDTKRLAGLRSPKEYNIQLYSKTIDISKFEPRILHYYEQKQRTLFFKGMLNGEEVYFKLEVIGGGKAKVSYIPVEEKVIPRAILISDKEDLGKSDLLSDDTLARLEREAIEGASSDSSFGGKKSAITADSVMSDDKKSVTTKLKATETGEEFGTFQAEEGKLDANMIFSDQEKKNLVGVDVSGGENPDENNLGVDYTHKEEHYQTVVGADNKKNGKAGVFFEGEKTKLSVDSTIKEGELEKVGAGVGLSGEKGKVNLSSVGTKKKLQEAQLKGETKLLSVDVGGGHKKSFISDSSESELSVEKGKIKNTSNLKQGEDSYSYNTKFDYKVSDNMKLNLSYGDNHIQEKNVEVGAEHNFGKKDKKETISYAAKVELREENNSKVMPKVAYTRELKKNKTFLKTELSSALESGSVENLRARVEWEKKLTKDSSMGFYVEGELDDREGQKDKATLGVNAKIEWGGDSKSHSLIKKHVLREIVENNGSFLAYYDTWRYECNLKKKKLKVIKPRKKFWLTSQKAFMSHLYQYVTDSFSTTPKVIYSPKNAKLENFCK